MVKYDNVIIFTMSIKREMAKIKKRASQNKIIYNIRNVLKFVLNLINIL